MCPQGAGCPSYSSIAVYTKLNSSISRDRQSPVSAWLFRYLFHSMWTCTVLYHLLYLLVPGDHLTTPNGITYHMYHAVFDVSAPRGRLVGFIDHTAGPLLGTCCLSHRILYIVVCYRFPYGRLCYRRWVGQNLPIRDGSRISSR
jgi:hypothetical protein